MYLYSLFLVSLFSLFFLLFYFFVQDQLSSMAWSLLWIPSLPDGALPFPLNSQSSWQLFPWQLLALLFKCLSLGYKEQWDIALMACQRHFSQCLIHINLPSVFECPWWHHIHSVWSIKQAGPTLTQEIHFNTQHQRRGRNQLPKKEIWLHFYRRNLLPVTCCMYLSSQNLSSLSLIAWSPSLSLCQSFLSSHLSLALGIFVAPLVADDWKGTASSTLG